MAEADGTDRGDEAGSAEAPVARVHRVVVVALQLVMAVELGAALMAGLWPIALLVVAVMGLTVTPLLFRERLPIKVPFGLQLAAVLFVFASLFLGEVRDFYERIWWWDMALHLASGLLLGVVGFMLVFILNRDGAERALGPGFVALFVFAFALAAGAVWEMFEFAVDVSLGTELQRPMLSDGTGLTDTMWDLNLDALGALLVAIAARRRMIRGGPSLLESWLDRMAHENPRLLPRRPRLGLRLGPRRRAR